MTGLAHMIRFHVVFVTPDGKTWDMYLDHRVPPIGETIRINSSNILYRVVDIHSDLTVPVEKSDHGPTMGFYDKLTIELEEI